MLCVRLRGTESKVHQLCPTNTATAGQILLSSLWKKTYTHIDTELVISNNCLACCTTFPLSLQGRWQRWSYEIEQDKIMKGGDPYICPYVCSWFYTAMIHLYNHKCYNQHTIPECVLLENWTGNIKKKKSLSMVAVSSSLCQPVFIAYGR